MQKTELKGKIKLVIGLGNPGPAHKNTYHNAGLMFLDYLEKLWGRTGTGGDLHLLKSNMYMNESGKFVKNSLKKYGARPGELLIAHDDSDIELGNYKLSFDRGAAGHHGIESVIQSLGTKKFWRLRLGIRPTGSKKRAEEFVLRKIGRNDAPKLGMIFAKIADILGFTLAPESPPL